MDERGRNYYLNVPLVHIYIYIHTLLRSLSRCYAHVAGECIMKQYAKYESIKKKKNTFKFFRRKRRITSDDAKFTKREEDKSFPSPTHGEKILITIPIFVVRIFSRSISLSVPCIKGFYPSPFVFTLDTCKRIRIRVYAYPREK